MPFPEFESGRNRVLWFSRGWGRGHAIPDIEIIRAWQAMRADLEIRVVSYRLGAATFEEFGFPLIAVDVPHTSPIAELTVIAGRLIGWLDPDLVVAHEEFPAMPAAKIFRKPAVFLTDFFTDPAMYSMNALKFADQVLFLGQAGVFREPEWVKGRVRYLGPVLRQFRYGRGDQARARLDLGIARDAMVISVFPGSWREEQAPLLELVAAAFEQLEAKSKKLIWIAGADYELVRSRLGNEALVLEHSWDMDRLMTASDVAITKVNRITIFELCHLGVPALAVTFGLNPMDDQAVKGLEGVTYVQAKELTGTELASVIRDQAGRPGGSMPACSGATCAGYLDTVLTARGSG